MCIGAYTQVGAERGSPCYPVPSRTSPAIRGLEVGPATSGGLVGDRFRPAEQFVDRAEVPTMGTPQGGLRPGSEDNDFRLGPKPLPPEPFLQSIVPAGKGLQPLKMCPGPVVYDHVVVHVRQSNPS